MIAQQPESKPDLVREDFLTAYMEKWSVTREYANGLLRHVEIGAVQAELQGLYKKLCDAHMGTVLQHGAQVGQGLALAIKEVHSRLDEES
jgi:hypothetical protein